MKPSLTAANMSHTRSFFATRSKAVIMGHGNKVVLNYIYIYIYRKYIIKNSSAHAMLTSSVATKIKI
jgi:hypothetical protein